MAPVLTSLPHRYSSLSMDDEQWRPARGQVVFLVVERPSGEADRVSGLVMGGGTDGEITVDLRMRTAPGGAGTEVVASFVSPAALYRLRAKAKPRKGAPGLVDLTATAAMERVQRRAHPRAAVALSVSLGAVGTDGALEMVAAETVDLSAGGLSAHAVAPLAGGGALGVVVAAALDDGGPPLLALADVVSAEPAGAGARYRLSFSVVAEEARERVARFVLRRTAEGVDAQT